ncbi:hypothetical protein ACM66B_005732 [Microbotryomycetes sp. NB124-2]
MSGKKRERKGSVAQESSSSKLARYQYQQRQPAPISEHVASTSTTRPRVPREQHLDERKTVTSGKRADKVVFVMPELDENGDPIVEQGREKRLTSWNQSSPKKIKGRAAVIEKNDPSDGTEAERVPASSSSVTLPPHLAAQLEASNSPSPSPLDEQPEVQHAADITQEDLASFADALDKLSQEELDSAHPTQERRSPEAETLDEGDTTLVAYEQETQTPREWLYLGSNGSLTLPPLPAVPARPRMMHRLVQVSAQGLNDLLNELLHEHEERARLHKIRAGGLEQAVARRDEAIGQLTTTNTRLSTSLKESQTLLQKVTDEKRSLEFKVDVLEEKNRGLLQQNGELMAQFESRGGQERDGQDNEN